MEHSNVPIKVIHIYSIYLYFACFQTARLARAEVGNGSSPHHAISTLKPGLSVFQLTISASLNIEPYELQFIKN